MRNQKKLKHTLHTSLLRGIVKNLHSKALLSEMCQQAGVQDLVQFLGYRTDIKLLYAADFGVPQLRPRVVIVGIREDQDGRRHRPDDIYGHFQRYRRKTILYPF